jgi:hypothetical protein
VDEVEFDAVDGVEATDEVVLDLGPLVLDASFCLSVRMLWFYLSLSTVALQVYLFP